MERRRGRHHIFRGVIAPARGQVLAKTKDEFRLDHRHMEMCRRQFGAIPMQLAVEQAAGERPVDADMLLPGNAGGGDLPADRLPAR